MSIKFFVLLLCSSAYSLFYCFLSQIFNSCCSYVFLNFSPLLNFIIRVLKSIKKNVGQHSQFFVLFSFILVVFSLNCSSNYQFGPKKIKEGDLGVTKGLSSEHSVVICQI